jgi:alkylation response protein AidB-like acyl-CoA dehydrogenase
MTVQEKVMPEVIEASAKKRAPVGGSFLIDAPGSHEVFIPEDFDSDLLAFAKTADQFMEKEVVPRSREMETKEAKADKLPIQLLRKAADIGLCLMDIPEKYGGLDMGVIASMLINEKLGKEGSFSVTYGAHIGIGTIPIIYFGTEEQKEKYLPRLATAEIIGAYALTEPNSGSDALGAQTKAVLNDAGTHYVLNGTKMWITNGAWADSYIIFAKVDGALFSCFIVDRDIEGVESAPEEHKLGLRASSTTQIILEDAHVPVENLLGEVGKGHHIAFHTLNMGRFKLGSGTTGGMKHVLGIALAYANERKQFQTPIIEFEAMRAKIAEMTMLSYVSESMCYRIGGCMEALVEEVPKDDPNREDKVRGLIEEYAIESSIAKVFCSEALETVVDECLQIHGGVGFVEEYMPEKFYRDNRVNRIFEGTNEINRLLIPGMLLKRAMKGRLNLMEAIGAYEKKLATADFSFPEGDLLAQTEHAVELIKGLSLVASAGVTQKYMATLDKEQQLLMMLGDLAIVSYAADSALYRTVKLVERGDVASDGPQVSASALFAAQSLDKAKAWARNAIVATYEGAERAVWLAKIEKLSQNFDVNRVVLKRQLADVTVEQERYPLSNY